MAEVKTPMVEAIYFALGLYEDLTEFPVPLSAIADLIRQERERAFDAGAEAGEARGRAAANRAHLPLTAGVARRMASTANEAFAAARLAAVEGTKEGEGDATD